MSRPLRVFLCHASQDKPAVWKMYRFLKQRGVQPWLDQADLLPGQNWEVEIPKALFASDVILVCLSKNSVNKEGFVQKEISFALDKALEKPEGAIFIIPVKLEECDVPRRLGMYQWVDYYRTDGRKRLLRGLDVRSAELGDDVAPVILENTRSRPPAPKPIVLDVVKREAEEQAVREQAERDENEKTAREQAEREAAEKLASEKAEQKQKEIVARRVEELVRRQTSASTPEKENFDTPKPKIPVAKSSPKFASRLMGLGSIVLIALLFWGISAFLKDRPFTNPQEQNTATATAPVLTKTPTNTPPPTFTSTPGIGGIGSIYLSDGVTMLYVPAGTFSMGSETSSEEKPIHSVYLSAYYMDKFEVTNAAYKRCVEAGICDPPKQSNSFTRTAYYDNPEFDDHPVIYVDWNMAKTYCEWRGARLPTEAEWEKAARGTDGRTYPWGNDIGCDKVNYKSNCVGGDTTKIGSYIDGVSPYGMYDMAGNVWEWVNDWYDGSYYSTSPASNPQGPTLGQYRVLRGGTWYINDYYVRSASRFRSVPTSTYYDIGFRCALSQP
jgi:eukaryotic-like serine/threonine-protein kinase